MERQQVRERIRIVGGLGQHAIFVQACDDVNCFGHQVIGVLDHVVPEFELLLREID